MLFCAFGMSITEGALRISNSFMQGVVGLTNELFTTSEA